MFFGEMMGMLRSEDSGLYERLAEARPYDGKTRRETCSAPAPLVWIGRFGVHQSGDRE